MRLLAKTLDNRSVVGCIRSIMNNSKLTSKSQATISQKDKQVVIKKAMPMDIAYLQVLESTLTEWNSDNDEEDYRDL